MASYTIDLMTQDGRWDWRLYTRGGEEFITKGSGANLETASSDARTAMLIDARRTGDIH